MNKNLKKQKSKIIAAYLFYENIFSIACQRMQKNKQKIRTSFPAYKTSIADLLASEVRATANTE